MLREFARHLVIDAILSMVKAIPALAMLILAIWLITGMILSCCIGMNTKPITAQDYYICNKEVIK